MFLRAEYTCYLNISIPACNKMTISSDTEFHENVKLEVLGSIPTIILLIQSLKYSFNDPF